jgi:hypothetical protein
MEIAEFAQITQRVIAKDGFDGYLPTLALPARREINTLSGVPADVDVEQAATEWAARHAQTGEEYLLAYKISPTQFRIVRGECRQRTQADFTVESPRASDAKWWQFWRKGR